MTLLVFILQGDEPSAAVCWVCLVPVAIFVAAWLISSNARRREREQAEKEGRVYIGDFAQRAAYKEIGDQIIEAELKGSGCYVVVTEKIVFVGFGDNWGGERGVKRYPIDSISAVNIKRGLFTELEIIMPGAVEGAKKAADQIRFEQTKTPYEEVKKIADLILELREKAKAPALPPSPPVPPGQSVPELLTQLASLRDAGVITGEEFERKKKELLDKL